MMDAVPAFERFLSRRFSASYAVAVSSGTAAIHTALHALGIGSGDEVIVPAVSPVMTVAPVAACGATPVIVDCCVNGIDFDRESLAHGLSSRTRAIIVVHLWGHMCDMDHILSLAVANNIAIIEDACQAHGSTWRNAHAGTLGTIGCFSLREGKLISCEEGGFILTNRPDLAERCKQFRNHYIDSVNAELSFATLGMNYRLAPKLAAVAHLSANELDRKLLQRREQSYVLRDAVGQAVAGIQCIQHCHNNNYCVAFLAPEHMPPRALALSAAEAGIINSVGTFGLRPVYERAGVADYLRASGGRVIAKKLNASNLLNRVLACILRDSDEEPHLRRTGAMIQSLAIRR